jgi:SAM-dependent methyltransferase
MNLLDRLKLPHHKDLADLDAPQTTLRHREIIHQKYFLRNIYLDFYGQIQQNLADLTPCNMVVELGSGGGFYKEVRPSVIASDIMPLPHIDINFSGIKRPFKNESLDALVMFDVLHHIPDARSFFQESRRCLRPGGRMIMIEPANTLWSRFIYQYFHHETFDPQGDWSFPCHGPLSSANVAIPWILFSRDRQQFEQEFPELKIKTFKNHTPFRYVLSGGLSYCQFLPSFLYSFVVICEQCLTPFNNLLGMFLTIVLEKQEEPLTHG